MRKSLLGLAPLGAGLIVFAGVLVFLFERNPDLARWSLAIFLFGHGWVHVMFVMPQRAPAAQTVRATDNPFRFDRSWLAAPAHLEGQIMRVLGVILVAVVMIGFALAAQATVGFLVPVEWWAALVSFSSVASIVLLGVFFHPNLLLGVAINLVLLWAALIANWLPFPA